MLSMKYVDADGVEWIEGGFVRTKTTIHPESKRRTVSGDRPNGETHTFFQQEDDAPDGTTCPRVYVMNELGTTLASYFMGKSSIPEMAA